MAAHWEARVQDGDGAVRILRRVTGAGSNRALAEDLAQGLDVLFAHAECDAPLRAEQIGQHGNIGALGIFE